MSTRHLARICVMNYSGEPVTNMRLLHAFGDEFVEAFEWDQINDRTQSETKTVSYGTGFGSMTDYDWWVLSWETTIKKDNETYVVKHSSCPSVINMMTDYFLTGGSAAIDAASSSAGYGAVVGMPTAPSAAATSGSSAAGSLLKFLFGGVMRRNSKSAATQFNLVEGEQYTLGHNTPEVSFQIGKEKVLIATIAGRTKEMPYDSLVVPPEIGVRTL